MKKFVSFIIRLIVLLAGIALAGFMVWQFFTDASNARRRYSNAGPRNYRNL
ncbi:MAG: hypothetical protein ACFWTI_06310 [Lactobacillus helveticus]|jgi:uncharacterized membrane protein (DUF373 family)